METQNRKDRTLEITRLLNAPVELVYKVWTDPQHIKNWWGAAWIQHHHTHYGSAAGW